MNSKATCFVPAEVRFGAQMTKCIATLVVAMTGLSARAQIFSCEVDSDCPTGYTCLQNFCEKIFPDFTVRTKGTDYAVQPMCQGAPIIAVDGSCAIKKIKSIARE